jgi:teichuronic acid biosynthesis glycosyltransferase TuaC
VPEVRALVVTNMWPTPAAPQLGSFVFDQVAALRRIDGVAVDVFAFGPGPRALGRALADVRRRHRDRAYDVVHAHFGLSAWPALAARLAPVVVTLHGNDLFHPRTNRITRAALPFTALPAAVSRAFSANVPGAGHTRRVAVLPCGVDLQRFRPIPRRDARKRLGLHPREPFLLFPHDPARPLKRFDRARELARAAGVPLRTLGRVTPADVPLWHNAANAVVVPSQDEGFGLAVIEASACDVPALGTPVGIHALALGGIEGSLCAPFELERWLAVVGPHLESEDPRVRGRARAELFSAERMALRVHAAWRALLAERAEAVPGNPL